MLGWGRLTRQAWSSATSISSEKEIGIMSLKKALLSLIGLIVFGVPAVAQEPWTQVPPTNAQGRREQRMRLHQRRMRQDRMRLGQALQLSDDQRQLRKAIRQKHLEATKSQREQLFQLRERRRAGS